MLTEKAMEDQIAQAPERFLGEAGLHLVGRQVRFGQYIFDLLFEDRHGGKLIVELQKGTLDRSHMYKILDYYDAFKERNPAEFVDLMVIASVISAERKRRLHDRGIEFREISETMFATPAPSEANIEPSIHPESITANGGGTLPSIDSVSPITPQVRNHAATKSRDHFGLSGFRAAIACLYARPKGATQAEVNEVAKSLGSTQVGYYNMLRQAQGWNHSVVIWNDPERCGTVFKLIYNPSHSGPRGGNDPPANWEELNIPNTPSGVKSQLYPPRERRTK